MLKTIEGIIDFHQLEQKPIVTQATKVDRANTKWYQIYDA